jgi:hypothetical protein
MSTIRQCVVIVLHFVNNCFLQDCDTCRWITASHRNVLPVAIFRVEGLGPSLDTKVIKVRMWFGYIDQLQGRWSSESQKERKGAEQSGISLPSSGSKLATFVASGSHNQTAFSPQLLQCQIFN